MAGITALSTLTYAALPPSIALEHVQARGFRAVELAHDGASCQHLPPGSAATEAMRAMLRVVFLQPIALDYRGGGRGLDSSSRSGPAGAPLAPHRLHRADEAERYADQIRRVIVQCRSLGIVKLNVDPGDPSEEADWREQSAAAARVISELAEYGISNGVRLTVEAPHRASLLDSVERTAEFFSYVSSDHLGITTSASDWGALKYDLGEFWHAVGPRLWHVHLDAWAGDGAATTGAQPGTPTDRSAPEIGRFGEWLDRHGYRGNVTVALEDAGTSLDETERNVDRVLRELAQSGWQLPGTVRVG